MMRCGLWTTLTILIAIALGLPTSCFGAWYCCWYGGYGTEDWSCPDTCGGGGSPTGTVPVSYASGTVRAPNQVPGMSCCDAGGLHHGGPGWTWWADGCGYHYCFGWVYESGPGSLGVASTSGHWECWEHPETKLETENGETPGGWARITLPNGSTYYYVDTTSEPPYYPPTKPSTLTDPLGREYNFHYDESGRLDYYEMPDGRKLIYGYDEEDRPISVQAPDGEVHMLLEYNDPNDTRQPSKITLRDPDNPALKREIRFTYASNGKVTSVIADNGRETVVEYDVYGRAGMIRVLNRSAGANGEVYSQTSFEYTSGEEFQGVWCKKTTIREFADVGTVDTPGTPDDNYDRITERYYYYSGFLRAIRESWHEDGDPNKPRSRTTVYDVETQNDSLLGVVRTVTLPTGVIVTLEYYDPNKEYVVPTDQYSYDPNDLATVPYGEDTSGQGGVAGNRLVRTMTITYPSQTSYTQAYRYYVKTVGSDRVMTPFVTLLKDARNQVTKNVINLDGSLAERWEPDVSLNLVKVGSLTYYDGSLEPRDKGLIASATVYDVGTYGDDMVTTYTYAYETDGARSLTATCDGKSKSYHQNALGQTIWAQDVAGNRTDYQYDYQGRLVKTTAARVLYDGETELDRKTRENSYSCCALEWAKDENGHKTYFAYDGAGRPVKTWTDIAGQSESTPAVLCTYNGPFGTRDTVTTYMLEGSSPTGRATEYIYDTMGFIRRVDHPDQLIGSEEFIYDELGRLCLRKDGNGDVTAMAYDECDRLSAVDYDYEGSFELVTPWPPPSFVPDVTYEYLGNTKLVRQTTETIDGMQVVSVYEYDPQGRLIAYTPGLPAGYGTVTYTYNNLGQKTSMTVPLGYGNKAVRIVYKYDKGERPTGMDVIPCTVANSQTQLETTSPASVSRFFYDHSGNRVKMINKAGDVYCFVYDPTAPIPAVVYEQGPQYRYLNVRGPTGVLLGREKYLNGNRVGAYTYHFDGQGNTIALSDAAGNVTDRYTYDAWGNVTSHQGSTNDNPYQYLGRFGYYTHYQEPTLGYLQLGARYYDPHIGRFTQLDPIRDETNWYGYAGNNPLIGFDPTGLKNEHHWYDGWLNGDWGMCIPFLGELTDHAGYTYGMWEGGHATTGEMLKDCSVAAGAVIAAGFCIGEIGYYGASAMASGAGGAAEACSAELGGALGCMEGATTIGGLSYAPRVFERAAQCGYLDAGHRFPLLFDEWIVQTGISQSIGDYISYRLPGWINTTPGFYDIGIRGGVVVHRCFVEG